MANGGYRFPDLFENASIAGYGAYAPQDSSDVMGRSASLSIHTLPGQDTPYSTESWAYGVILEHSDIDNSDGKFNAFFVPKNKLNFSQEAKGFVEDIYDPDAQMHRLLGYNRDIEDWGILFVSVPNNHLNKCPQASSVFVPNELFWAPQGTGFEELMPTAFLMHLRDRYPERTFTSLSNGQKIDLIRSCESKDVFVVITEELEKQNVEVALDSFLDVDVYAGPRLILPVEEKLRKVLEVHGKRTKRMATQHTHFTTGVDPDRATKPSSFDMMRMMNFRHNNIERRGIDVEETLMSIYTYTPQKSGHVDFVGESHVRTDLFKTNPDLVDETWDQIEDNVEEGKTSVERKRKDDNWISHVKELEEEGVVSETPPEDLIDMHVTTEEIQRALGSGG